MKDLAIGNRGVAVLLEVSIERCDPRGILLGPGQMVDKPRWMRPNARHERGSRRTTSGDHAIGSFKDGAFRRQPIDIGGMNMRHAVAANFRAKIIYGNEQHIWPLGCLCYGACGSKTNQDNKGETHEVIPIKWAGSVGEGRFPNILVLA